jgi:protein-disulfide isomerase
MFWPFHDALFSAAYPLGQEAYENYANELGMDAGALLECLDSGKYEEEVQADARFVANLGASGTPTFFVNGIPLVGAQPLSRFSQIIDQELDQ